MAQNYVQVAVNATIGMSSTTVGGIPHVCSRCRARSEMRNDGPGYSGLCNRCVSEHFATQSPRWGADA